MDADDTAVLFSRPIKTGFRHEVRDYIGASGSTGVSRAAVMTAFAEYSKSKITIALNELLVRREAYLRNGIYRLTTRVELNNNHPT